MLIDILQFFFLERKKSSVIELESPLFPSPISKGSHCPMFGLSMLLIHVFCFCYICIHRWQPMVLLYVFDNIYILGHFEACFFHSMVHPLTFSSCQWKKAEEKLERELREAEASESTEKKLKLVSSFTFFRLLQCFVKLFLLEIYVSTCGCKIWVYFMRLSCGKMVMWSMLALWSQYAFLHCVLLNLLRLNVERDGKGQKRLSFEHHSFGNSGESILGYTKVILFLLTAHRDIEYCVCNLLQNIEEGSEVTPPASSSWRSC